MKLLPVHAPRFTLHGSRPRRRQSGSAVIVVLALLTILLIYVAGNIRTLNSLGAELRLLERQQTLRLQPPTTATNTPVALTTHQSTNPSIH